MTTPLGSRYELIETIASGATGTVWRARVRETGELVAAKEIRAELSADADVVDRFLRERRVLSSIQHPAVVRLRDLVVEGDRIGLVMDLVEGADLRSALADSGPLAPGAAIALAATVADALTAAHAAGVVHADVKPANILVPADGSPVRLADFGVARLVRGPAPTSYGTPEYIAPEVVLGHASVPASDVYGLGIVLYELLTSSTPYRGGSVAEVMQRHVSARPIWTPAVPERMRPLLTACLHRDPVRRPSAEWLAADLRALAPELVDDQAATPLPTGTPHFRMLPVAETLAAPVEPDDSVTSILSVEPDDSVTSILSVEPDDSLTSILPVEPPGAAVGSSEEAAPASAEAVSSSPEAAQPAGEGAGEPPDEPKPTPTLPLPADLHAAADASPPVASPAAALPPVPVVVEDPPPQAEAAPPVPAAAEASAPPPRATQPGQPAQPAGWSAPPQRPGPSVWPGPSPRPAAAPRATSPAWRGQPARPGAPGRPAPPSSPWPIVVGVVAASILALFFVGLGLIVLGASDSPAESNAGPESARSTATAPSAPLASDQPTESVPHTEPPDEPSPGGSNPADASPDDSAPGDSGPESSPRAPAGSMPPFHSPRPGDPSIGAPIG